MSLELALGLAGVVLSSILLAENIALKSALALIAKGRTRAARRVLKLALQGPVLWSSRDQKAYCLQLYLSVSESPVKELPRVEAFLQDREELSPLWEGLLLYELSKLLTLEERESEAREIRSEAWQLLNRAEENPVVFYPLAVLALALGFKSNAETFYRRSLSLGLERNRSRLGLALVSQDEEEQRALLQAVIDSEESADLAGQARGLLAGLTESSQERLELLQDSVESGLPQDLDWLTRTLRVSALLEEGRKEEAEAELEILRKLPCENPNLWAVTLSEADLFDEAAEVFRQHPPEDDSVATLHLNASYRCRDQEATAKLARHYLEKPAKDPMGRLLLLTQAVQIWHGQGDLDRAEEFLLSHRTLLEQEKDYLMLQAEQARLKGEIDQALQFCARAREAGELAPEIRCWWSLGDFQSVREGLGEIRAERGEDDLHCAALEAAALVTEERHSEGLEALQQVLERITDPEGKHYHESLLALTEAENGQQEQARTRLADLDARASDLTCGSALIYQCWRVEVLLALGEPEDALSTIASIKDQVPPIDLPSLLYSQGRAHQALGGLEQARESLKQAAGMFPNTLYARRAKDLLEKL